MSREHFESQLGKQQPTIVTAETIGLADTAAARMREQLYALEIRQQELESRETPAHPQLIQIKAQVAQAHETLGQEITPSQVTKGENRTYIDLELAMFHNEANAASLGAEKSSLGNQLADARHALQTINESELEITSLQRDIEVSRTKYRRYVDNLEQARIDQALATERISNINILQQPTVSYTPVRPRAAFNLAGGFGLGLILAMAVIAWAETRRRAAMLPLYTAGQYRQ